MPAVPPSMPIVPIWGPVCGCQESMRIIPVAGGTARVCARDVLLGGKYLIPRNTPIVLALHAIQNSWRNWEEPDRFLPERWLVPGVEYAVPGLTRESTVSGAVWSDKPHHQPVEVLEVADSPFGDALAGRMCIRQFWSKMLSGCADKVRAPPSCTTRPTPQGPDAETSSTLPRLFSS